MSYDLVTVNEYCKLILYSFMKYNIIELSQLYASLNLLYQMKTFQKVFSVQLYISFGACRLPNCNSFKR